MWGLALVGLDGGLPRWKERVLLLAPTPLASSTSGTVVFSIGIYTKHNQSSQAILLCQRELGVRFAFLLVAPRVTNTQISLREASTQYGSD